MRAESVPGEEEEEDSDCDEPEEALDLNKASVFLMDAEFDRWKDNVLRLLELMISVFLLLMTQDNKAELRPHVLSTLDNCQCPVCKSKSSASLRTMPTVASGEQTHFYSLVKCGAQISSRGTSIHGLNRSFLQRHGAEYEEVRRSVCELVAHCLNQNQQLLVISYGGSSDVRILLEILQASEHWGKWRHRVFFYDVLTFVRAEKRMWSNSDLDSLIDGDQDSDFLKYAVSLSLRMLVGEDAKDLDQFHDAKSDVENLAKLIRKLLDERRAEKLLSAIKTGAISLSMLESRMEAKKRKEEAKATAGEKKESLLQGLQNGLRELGFIVELDIPAVTASQQKDWKERNQLWSQSSPQMARPETFQETRKSVTLTFSGGNGTLDKGSETKETPLQVAQETTSWLQQAEEWWSRESYFKWRVSNIFFNALKHTFCADEKIHIQALVAVSSEPQVFEVWALFKDVEGLLPPKRLGIIQHSLSIDKCWYIPGATEKLALVYEVRNCRLLDAKVQTIQTVSLELKDDGKRVAEELGAGLKAACKFGSSLSSTSKADSKGGANVVCGLLLDPLMNKHVMLPRLYLNGDSGSRCCLCDSFSRRKKRRHVWRSVKSGVDVVRDYLSSSTWSKFTNVFLSSLPCLECRKAVSERGRTLLVSSSTMAKIDGAYLIGPELNPDSGNPPNPLSSKSTIHTIKLGNIVHTLDRGYLSEISHGRQIEAAFTMALLASGLRSVPQTLSFAQHSALLGLLIQGAPRPLRRPDPGKSRKSCIFFQCGDSFSERCGLSEVLRRRYQSSFMRQEKSQEADGKKAAATKVDKHGVLVLIATEDGSYLLNHTSKFATMVDRNESFHWTLREVKEMPRSTAEPSPKSPSLNRFAILSQLTMEEERQGDESEHRLKRKATSSDGDQGTLKMPATVETKNANTKFDDDKSRRIHQLAAEYVGKGDMQALAKEFKRPKKKTKKRRRTKQAMTRVSDE